MSNRFLVLTFLLSAIISQAQSNPFQNRLPVIDHYIDSFMKEWNIPGMALGIVYKDRLLYAKGYGFRDLKNKLPVETTTLFPIASQAKLFTATAACILAEEGKLSLDQPVRTYLPSLQFSNDELNAKVTLRDMLSHRTGLASHDAILLGASLTRKELVDKVVYMKPQLVFREGFIYNNIMYITAGAAMEKITGMPWEEIIIRKFFQPLQMKASCFTNEAMVRYGNFAYSYYEPDSSKALERMIVPIQNAAEGPEGTIISNIEDVSHWMIAQLNEGRYNGQQVIPEAAIKKTLVPHIIDDLQLPGDEASTALYGLGRGLQMYKGYTITAHTGGRNGFYSNLTFIPSENIGVFLIHNGAMAGSVRLAMVLPIIDRLLNLSPTPWSERYRKAYLQNKAESKRAKDSIHTAQVKNTSPSHPLKDYTGTYENPAYGEMSIALQNDQLVLLFRNQKMVLHHFHYDQFFTKKEMRLQTDFGLHFFTNKEGAIDSFSAQFGDVETGYLKSTANKVNPTIR